MIKSHNKSSILLSILLIFFATSLYAKGASAKMIKHAPFANGECGKCHVDKKGKNAKLKDEVSELCYSCHKTYKKNNFIHGPVAAGACTLCHDPHESKNPKLLLNSSINELCTSCHTEKGEMLKTKSNIHPPVKDKCTNCHDPHAENFKFQLKADRKKDLCLMCHVEKKERITNSKIKHGAIEMGDKCIGCHNPHTSGNPKLLRAEDSKTLCLKCHNKSVTTDEDNQKLLNIGEHLAKNTDWHGPILWGDCAACHNPHGSNNFRMLKKPFPKGSTVKFSADGYICFNCHEPKKITDKYTIEDTNFRDGDKNIHYIHVNSKRITCRACHDFHGTKKYPHHLREESTFGTAKFSIRYIGSPTGGSCDPICHNRRSYDRNSKLINSEPPTK